METAATDWEKDKGAKTMRTNKYLYLWIVQGNYGYGWEDLTQSEYRYEMTVDLRLYRENSPEGTYRLIRRREPNPNYQLQGA